MDSVKEGGIVAVITSTSTLDKQSENVRREYAKTGELLGAVRLPSNALKKIAGTDVVTDLIFFQKNSEIERSYTPSWVFVGMHRDVPGKPFNNYFVKNTDMILGELLLKNFRGKTLDVKANPEANLIDELNLTDSESNPSSSDVTYNIGVKDNTRQHNSWTLIAQLKWNNDELPGSEITVKNPDKGKHAA